MKQLFDIDFWYWLGNCIQDSIMQQRLIDLMHVTVFFTLTFFCSFFIGLLFGILCKFVYRYGDKLIEYIARKREIKNGIAGKRKEEKDG